eukprot:5815697-Prymnesium_polylepis.1
MSCTPATQATRLPWHATRGLHAPLEASTHSEYSQALPARADTQHPTSSALLQVVRIARAHTQMGRNQIHAWITFARELQGRDPTPKPHTCQPRVTKAPMATALDRGSPKPPPRPSWPPTFSPSPPPPRWLPPRQPRHPWPHPPPP